MVLQVAQIMLVIEKKNCINFFSPFSPKKKKKRKYPERKV